MIELGPAYGDALIADIAIEEAPITDMAVALWLARPTSTAGDTIHITDVQLEPGGRASPFERQTAGLVRLLCDRYYQRYAFHGLQRCVTTVIGTADTDSAIGPFRYRNAMRSPPRFVTSGTSWSAFDGQVDLTGCDLRARAPGVPRRTPVRLCLGPGLQPDGRRRRGLVRARRRALTAQCPASARRPVPW